jgi:hypothetical protein
VRLKRVGYWGEAGSGLPAPPSLVDDSWAKEDRFVVRACMGTASCRNCGERIGSLELTDGVYVWRRVAPLRRDPRDPVARALRRARPRLHSTRLSPPTSTSRGGGRSPTDQPGAQRGVGVC